MTVASDQVLSEIKARGFELVERLLGSPVRVDGPNALWFVPWRDDGRNPGLVVLRQPKGGRRAGCWNDFGRKESGDPLDLLARARGLDPKTDFPKILTEACRLLGIVREPAGAHGGHASGSEPVQAALDAMAARYGLQWSDFVDAGCEARRSPKGNFVSYPIRMADGAAKKFKSTDRDEHGKRRSWGEKGSGFSAGLFDLGLDSCRGATLVIAGGEEKAIAARISARCAVAPASGEKALQATQIDLIVAAAPFRVIIAYDADEAGEKGSGDVAAQLLAAGIPDVRIVAWPPDVPHGYDLTDHLVAHGTAGVAEILDAAAAHASASAAPSVHDDWPELIPLEGQRPAPFDRDMLPPGFLRCFVQQAVETYQQPMDFVALGALGFIAGAMAGTWEVQPKPDWHEPVQLWSLLVGDSGVGKSAMFDMLSRPIQNWEAESRNDPEFRRRVDEKGELEARKAKIIGKKATAGANGADPDRLREFQKMVSEVDLELDRLGPVEAPQIIIDDATPEALVERMAKHNGRALVMSAEGNVFNAMAGQYSDQANLAIYLKGHAGDFVKVDRRGKPPMIVNRPALGMVICAQPGVVERFLRNQEFIDCGLVFRFLAINPERAVGVRKYRTSPLPVPTKNEWEERLRRLLDVKCPQGKNRPQPHAIRLDDTADRRMEGYWEETRDRQEVGDLSGTLAPFGGKLAGQTLRIAAALHAMNIETLPHDTPIDAVTLEHAIRIADYVAAHVKFLFDSAGAGTDAARAKVLWRRIKAHEQPVISKREMRESLRGNGQFKRAEDFDGPINYLVQTGHIRDASARSGQRGRPSERFERRPEGECA